MRTPPQVVVSTNVAETSITIPDITVVIDTGRVKETAYDPQTNMPCLLETWTSKDSMRQRRGRAGRVQVPPSPPTLDPNTYSQRFQCARHATPSRGPSPIPSPFPLPSPLPPLSPPPSPPPPGPKGGGAGPGCFLLPACRPNPGPR